MADTAPSDDPLSTLRSDAVASRQRILDAAAALRGDRRTSMAQIAAAAGVGRSPLSRHFASRQLLEDALDRERPDAAAEPAGSPEAGSIATLAFQPPGRLGRDRPLPLE